MRGRGWRGSEGLVKEGVQRPPYWREGWEGGGE